ncbi:MAG: hypothetical protein KDN05_01455 [Verrucomicrobiae bacterium]|nr:hypothetical protein [Verrucomicrobiae bacterium]
MKKVSNEPSDDHDDVAEDKSSESPHGGRELDKLIARVGQCVLNVPYSYLMGTIRKSRGYDDTPANVLRHRADGLIRQLAFEAEIGNEDAIVALREIGNQVASHLAELVGNPEDEVEAELPKCPEDDSGYYYDGFDISELPELDRLLCELAEADVDDLERRADQLSGVPAVFAPVLKEDLFGPAAAPAASLISVEKVTEGSGQLRSFERLCEMLEEAKAADPDSVCMGRIKRKPDPSSPPIKEPDEVVEEIVQNFIGQRALHVARRVARRVVEGSVLWPISVFAVADSRAKMIENYVSGLGLGRDLGVRFYPKTGQGGTRVFRHGSQGRMALDIWMTLESERQRKANSPGYLDALKAVLSGEGDADVDNKPNWRRRAQLLPRFSGESGVLEKWVSAAMVWAERRCGGKWDEERFWPECVTKRMKYDEKNMRLRGGREVVAEKIREGFKMLLP